MDSYITRGEFEPVKTKAETAKDLAERNREDIEKICKENMKFQEANNQEHKNILITIAKMVENLDGNEKTLGEIKKILWWVLCTIIVSLVGAAGTAIWYIVTHG